MSLNPNYDAWADDEVMNLHQLNGVSRFWFDFVMDGLAMVDAGGLLLNVGIGYAYIGGYEVFNAAPDFVLLTDGALNYVFFGFDRTPDPGSAGGVELITPKVVVNTTGIPPADTILLGTVTTGGGIILTIAQDENLFRLPRVQLDTNLDGNHKQIETLVIHKDVALPSVLPPTEEGQLFFRTTDKKLFKFDGTTWVELAAAVAPPPPGAIPIVNAEITPLLTGEIVRAAPGMPGSVLRASAAVESESFGIGVVVAPIPPFAPGFAASVQGVLATMKLEPGLLLTSGELIYESASPFFSGSGTNVPTAVIGAVNKVVAVLWDPTGYDGFVVLTVTVLLYIQQGTVVS